VLGDRLLVAAEVAGLLLSDDGGRTWICEPVAGDEDVHHVTGHADDCDVLYVSLGSASLNRRGGQHGGIARSRDGGRTWEKVETDYTRATIVPPERPDLLVAGPALRVGRGGRIVVSSDGGDTWQPAGHGIDVPMPDMVELFVPAPDGTVWAICSGGRLLRATARDLSWASALPPDSGVSVKSVAFAADERG
jgi:BNR/Asp-box repeat